MIQNIDKAISHKTLEHNSIIIIEPRYLSDEELEPVDTLLEQSYYKSNMAKSFRKCLSAGKKQICALIYTQEGQLIGFRVAKPYDMEAFPAHVYENYPQIFTKHLCIHPEYRSQGLGKALIHQLNEAAFLFFKTPILWSASGEIGALSLYAREGALLYKDAIHKITRAHPEKNEQMFKAMLTTPTYKWWRLDRHIPYAWYESNQEKPYLLSRGFEELI